MLGIAIGRSYLAIASALCDNQNRNRITESTRYVCSISFLVMRVNNRHGESDVMSTSQ